MDAGCGTGGLLQYLQRRGYTDLSGFDVSREAVAIAKQRGLPVQQGDLRQKFPGPNEAIISNDTLYFLTPSEQRDFLERCAQSLAPGGLLLLNVPALRAFRGIHDLSVGIGRRFTQAEVRALFADTELSIQQIRFWPFFLSPLIYARRVLQRIRLQRSKQSSIRSDLDLPPAFLNQLFEAVTRVENAVLPWKPFGSSLFVVAKKLPVRP